MYRIFNKLLFVFSILFFSQANSETKNEIDISIDRPVYFLAQVKVTDKNKFFNEYVPEVKKHIKAAGGEIIFGGMKPSQQLEGDWDFFTIAIKFPSKAAHDKFYFSEGNLKVAVPLRKQSSSVNNLMVY